MATNSRSVQMRGLGISFQRRHSSKFRNRTSLPVGLQSGERIFTCAAFALLTSAVLPYESRYVCAETESD